MDHGQKHPLQRPGLPAQQQDSSASSPSQQQPPDATLQDVLVEDRKNLQVLIDSGLSRDLLHQLVDDSQSLQLSFPSLLQSLASSQSLTPQHPPPPPPPQCPPPPTPTVSPPEIKAKALPDDVARVWHPSTLDQPPPPGVGDVDAALFLPPSAPFAHYHRPRISVSSVSSGSSGHASIWSTNSAQSNMSWHSAGGRCMAPLPMPPPTPGGPVLNGAPVPSATAAAAAAAAAAASPSQQNVYWCTSCETSFKRKYDWKRHEDEFHERWRKYPCPEPGCNRSFWGSNSFNQHHKQCHGCKTCPHAEKVVRFLRKRKYWACGFCSALHPARERHVEHVACHFKSGMTKADWMHSRVIYGLLHQPLIRETWLALVTGKQPEYAGRRPQFNWHPSKTGRAQGFLEKESDGQLQDLLEFFSGDDAEAQWIVKSAYDLADIVLTAGPFSSPPLAAGVTPQHPPQHPPSHYPHDAHASSPLPSHAQPPHAQPPHAQPQPTLPSPSPNGQSPYTSPFRATMFLPSQQFAAISRPSPDSASQSPLMASHSPLLASQSPLPPSHSPMAPSHPPLDHRELPQLPSSGPPPADSAMDFEYSPAPVVFDDWDALAGAAASDATPQPPAASQADWGMMQYFDDPCVTS